MGQDCLATDHTLRLFRNTSPKQRVLHALSSIQDTVNASARLSRGQLAYRNPHRVCPEVFPRHNDKGGVHHPYTGTMEASNPEMPVSVIAQKWATLAIAKLEGTTVDLTTVYDCMGSKLASLTIPPGVLMAGYITGSGEVPWTAAQFAQHPTAIRIDQSPIDTPFDETADMIDVEPQAGTIADVPGWVHGAWTSYRTARRPGQRTPTVYVEQSEETPVANTLNASGITSGVNLFLSEPMPEHAAIQILTNAGGPFPIVGVQYEFSTDYDVSLVSTGWLNNVSAAAPHPAPKPGTQEGWRFCSKCQGLFWGPGESRSVCPRGAQHDGSQSHIFALPFIA